MPSSYKEPRATYYKGSDDELTISDRSVTGGKPARSTDHTLALLYVPFLFVTLYVIFVAIGLACGFTVSYISDK